MVKLWSGNYALKSNFLLHSFVGMLGLAGAICADGIVPEANASSINLNYQPVAVDSRQCLPPKRASRPTPPSFLSKVYEEMKLTCSSANLSEKDRLEYLTITLGVSVPNPATPYLAAYGGAKFTGFMKDCMAQAFLNSSVSNYRAEDRQVLKDAIGGIKTAKGWADYVKGLPEMGSEDKVQDLNEHLDEAKKQAKEGPGNQTVSDYLSGAYKTAERALRLVSMGQMQTLVGDADYALEACRFDEAKKTINAAESFALQNCKEYGWQLRQKEKAFLSYVQRHRTTVERSIFVKQGSELSNLHEGISRTKNTLFSYISNEIYDGGGKQEGKGFLGKIEAKKQEVEDRSRGFKEQQKKHAVQLSKVLDALQDGSARCQTIAALEKRFHHYSAQCRREFFKGSGAHLWGMDELYDRLVQNGRKQIGEWWDLANEARVLFHNCKSDEAERVKSVLQAEMVAHPVYSYSAGQCAPKKLTELQDHLANLVEPNHCHKRAVPKVVGQPLDRATDAIYEAGLVPGEIFTLENDQGKWDNGTVVKTDPKGGSVVPPQSAVDLFKAGKAPEKTDTIAQMVNVPNVVGEFSADAANLINAAGLVASVNDDEPADDLEEEPDRVYGSAPKPGDAVAAGSTIVLNAYGPRPVAKVPNIGSLSFEAAKSLLAANKFHMTSKPALGVIAPEDAEPGEIYASLPPAQSLQEIFTYIQPLIYAQELRLVPKLGPSSVDNAKGVIIGKDGFFKVGEIALGKPATEEKLVGEVYGSIPPADAPRPRGTLVSPLIYAPIISLPVPPAQNDADSRPRCPEPKSWNEFMKQCANQKEFADYCEGKYPGSVPAPAKPQGCACPKGTNWSKTDRKCIRKKQRATKASGKYSRLCSLGKGKAIFVWDANGNRYGCQDKKYGSKNFAARDTPIIVAVPGQVSGRHVDCPVAHWPPKITRVVCVPKNARSPKPGSCATYHLTQINKTRHQKYCYFYQ